MTKLPSPPSFGGFFHQLRQYIFLYDPSHASFFYSCKAIIALCASFVIGYYVLDLQEHILFAVLSCVFVFYMHVFDALGLAKAAYLGLFIAYSSVFIYFIEFFASLGVWLFVPTFAWVFWVSFLQQVRADLFRVSIYSTILCLSSLVFWQNHTMHTSSAILGVVLGGGIATFLRCVSFHTYGAFTQKSFLSLLNDLSLMARHLSDKGFDDFNSLFITHLAGLRSVFSSKSVKIKDPSFIKHHKLAIFYLYKCEEIGEMLVCVNGFCKKHKQNSHIKNIQNEIYHNIRELAKLFSSGTPTLHTDSYNHLKSTQKLPILCDLLDVLMYKFELFIKGGEILPQTTTTPSFAASFKSALLDTNHIRLSIKTALAASLGVFIALFFELDHGIWVVMGVFSIIKARQNSTRIAIYQTVLGALCGFLIGYGLIVAFSKSWAFMPIILLSYFACIYFKHYPYTISVASIMANLALFFALIGADYERLIIYRMIDIGISLVIVLLVSSLLWPSRSEDDIVPSILSIIDKQAQFLNKQIPSSEPMTLVAQFSALIAECSNKRNFFTYHKILQSLKDLNSSIISLHSYIDSLLHLRKYTLASDIRLLSARFDMISNLTKDLPYYFYDDVRSKLSTSDPKVAYFLLLVAKHQDELYKNIKTLKPC